MRRDGRVSFLFCFALESTWPSLSAAPATVLSAGLAARVEPQAALRWTALAPLLARARALPAERHVHVAIMVTFHEQDVCGRPPHCSHCGHGHEVALRPRYDVKMKLPLKLPSAKPTFYDQVCFGSMRRGG